MFRELSNSRARWSGPWCVGGNWNIIKFPSERSSGDHLSADMTAFSDWINVNSLVDLQLFGAEFTWSNHHNPPTLSRLDRLKVSSDWLDVYPEFCQLALPKPASNHCPVLLDSCCKRWVPTPFCFEKMWLEEPQFSERVPKWWIEVIEEGWAGFRLAKKLKHLKVKIKEWAKDHFGDILKAKDSLMGEIQLLDLKEEPSQLSNEEWLKRFSLNKVLQRKLRRRNKVEAKISMQLA